MNTLKLFFKGLINNNFITRVHTHTSQINIRSITFLLTLDFQFLLPQPLKAYVTWNDIVLTISFSKSFSPSTSNLDVILSLFKHISHYLSKYEYLIFVSTQYQLSSLLFSTFFKYTHHQPSTSTVMQFCFIH